MNLLDNSIILEKIYAFSNLETKKNLEKYAEKVEFATTEKTPVATIQKYQKRNSSNGKFPCVWCMWQDMVRIKHILF